MNTEEINIYRHLPSFASRPHVKHDLLELLERVRVRVITCPLDDLRHFSVFNSREKLCFFDSLLPDEEFTERGFGSIVYHLLGGTAVRTDQVLSGTLAAKTDALVRQIIAPDLSAKINAEIRIKSPRRHHHIVPAVRFSPALFANRTI